MPNVAFTRPELVKLKPQYRVVRDVLGGAVAVKGRRELYLPRNNAEDKSPEAKAVYEAKLTRAVFYPVTERTLRGMVGEVFSRAPQIDVPPELKPMTLNINGLGVPITQQAKRNTGLVTAYGRAGLFTDYPTLPEGYQVTVADVASGKIAPTITEVEPERIINWQYEWDGGRKKLTLVVFEEVVYTTKDIFESKASVRWRVLRLDESGEYVQAIVTDKAAALSWFKPRDYDGRPFDYIPFDFEGGEDNDPEPDPVTLYGMADLNLAHFRNSASNEDSVFMVGEPTLILIGLKKEWYEKTLGGKVLLGSRTAIPLEPGSSAELLQMEPNTGAATEMERKERQMVALGAKLVEQKQVQRTATEASQEESAEASQLSTIADNVSAAYNSALTTARRFINGNTGGIKFALNTKFAISALDPASRTQLIKEWQAGAIVWEEMRAGLRRGGIAFVDDKVAKRLAAEEVQAAIEADPDPAGDIEDGDE